MDLYTHTHVYVYVYEYVYTHEYSIIISKTPVLLFITLLSFVIFY